MDMERETSLRDPSMVQHGQRTARDPLVPLPDFRNLGVLTRTILLINALVLAGAFIVADTWADIPRYFVTHCLRAEPLLLGAIAFLSLATPALQRLPAGAARWFAILGVMLLSVLLEGGWRLLGFSQVSEMSDVLRISLLSGSAAWVVLQYFSLRYQAIRPAVDAAQLAALTARIRPHFLFNSLNAVLSLIRKEPQRAEAALESLAELFRVLMRDPRDLVLLSDEIALCRQYLDLERLRLGDRLRVEWAIDDMPDDAQVPPLMLQPLVENAVYHGIEPADDGGILRIRFIRQSDALRIEIENPINNADAKGVGHTGGNQLALTNIRQRLALYYDIEASLQAEEIGGEYRVTLVIPVSKGGA